MARKIKAMTMSATEPFLYQVKDLQVCKTSASQSFTLEVDSVTIEPGEKIALTGPSGCGKSTLLDLLALVALPDKSSEFSFSPPDLDPVKLDQSFIQRSDIHNQLARLRKKYLGYVLQTGGLLPYLSVRQNIRLPQILSARIDEQWIDEIASVLKINHHLEKMPFTLSSGERQRVAIARALAHKPAVIIADEPTAALDPDNSDKVIELFVSLAENSGSSLIIATHDWERFSRFSFRSLKQSFRETDSAQHVVSVFSEG